MGNPGSAYHLPRLAPWRGYPASPQGGHNSEAAVTGYKLYCCIGVEHNHMAGQGDKSCAGKGWDTKLIHSLKAKVHAMARTCDTDERWPHSKRPFIWQTGDREKTNRTAPTTLQGRMQARPPGTWHKHRLLGSYCHRQRDTQ